MSDWLKDNYAHRGASFLKIEFCVKVGNGPDIEDNKLVGTRIWCIWMFNVRFVKGARLIQPNLCFI